LALAALLVSGTASAQAEARLQSCAVCHGADGNSSVDGVPSLAGQPKVFLENQLVLIREGLRGTELMQKLVQGIPDREIVAIATYYARQTLRPAPPAQNRALAERGRTIASERRCDSCHLPGYPGRDQIPRLAGQREDYLYVSMRSFRDDPRPGGDTIMNAELRGLADADLRALAHYLANLTGDRQ
jgi:cytochrome c553